MTTGRSNSPSWMPQLLTALGTVAVTWATIRTEVPNVVQAEVRAELVTHQAAMMYHVDSLWNTAGAILEQRIEERASQATDTVLVSMGLLAVRGDGPRPHITVFADTNGRHAAMVRMDSLAQQQRAVIRQLAILTVRIEEWKRTPNRRGRD